MEATVVASTAESQTIADLVSRAASAHGEKIAVRHKQDGAWHDVSYAQLADIVQEIGLGLIDLGVQSGERFAILAKTRPEWSYLDMAAISAGAVVVPIYQTNSPEECLWVMSDSGASTIVCEDEEQLEKIAAIHDRLADLRTVIVIDPPSSTDGSANAAASLQAITLEDVRKRGQARSPEELEARRADVRPEDPLTFIYTSGTTGPPKGCVLTHRNYRAIIDMISNVDEIREDEVTYLYLPLAHSFALLVQLASFDLGSILAYFGGDTTQVVAELMEVRPTYLPSVPRVFEKIYTLAHRVIEAQPPEQQAAFAGRDRAGDQGARPDGPRRTNPRGVADAIRGGRREALQERPRDLRRPRASRHEWCGAHRARDPRILLGLRRAGARGLRDDRDRHRCDVLDRRAPPLRHRRASPSRRAAEDRAGRRDPRQRSEHLRRLPQPSPHQLRPGRGRVAAHRRSGLDRRGRLPLDHRTQEGHHHHRRRQEPDAGQHRERPQAVALDLRGGDARRQAPVSGRADHVGRGRDPHLRARARPAAGRSPRSRATPPCMRSSSERSTVSTPTTPRSSRSRSSRSSTTTSPRRPAS